MTERPVTAAAAVPTSSSSRKPRDEELDFFGITHPGLVRKDNQDHFLVSTLHKTARVRSTSLPNPELFELPSQRIASFGMVADGVGGSSGGELASRAAVETITDYVKECINAFYSANEHESDALLDALREAARTSHAAVLERARESGQPTAATTLTLYVGMWPTLYSLHVGDSRLYLHRRGTLRRLTRDQTLAQDLIDAGAFPAHAAEKSPLAHVLTSAIGGSEAAPDVARTELERGDAILLCTDGLTKHVSEARIAEVMSGRTSAEQVARALVDEALAGGGTDNVTVLVVSGVRRWITPPAPPSSS